MKRKLRALQLVVVGGKYIFPGRGDNSIFEIDDDEAQRIIELGAAEDVGISAKAELTIDDSEFSARIETLTATQLRKGLEFLGFDVQKGMKKAELQAAFLNACEGNPVQASIFLDEVE